MNPAALEVVELTKIFPGKTPTKAVDQLSFRLEHGEILGLLGPNGAGKTTTIQMLLSTLTPTSGGILYFGLPFDMHRGEILEQVGYASAYSRMPRRLTVRETLDVFARLHGLARKERAQRIDELLDRFSAGGIKGRIMEGLSAGQTTRVTLAKAFLARPRVVLLDEPTASLDPDVAVVVRDFVCDERARRGVSIVFTSHNMDEVARVCDRVIFLDKGTIAGSGTPDELAASAATTRLHLRVTAGADQALAQAQNAGMPASIDGGWITIELDERKLATLLASLARAGVDYDEFTLEKPTLEDYFLKLSRARAGQEARP